MHRKNRLIRIALGIGIIACSAFFIPWILVKAWLSPIPETVREEVNAAPDLGLDGIMVYVDQAGQPSPLFAAGWKNKENKIPADPKSLFKIASISKLYLAVASAKLIQEQRLFLDKTLAEYLPELASRIENSDRITLKMLLQHRSGIPDWIDDPDFPWGKPSSEVSEVLELVMDEPADFEPDSRFDYSNTNYLLIGAILDKTLGYPHQEYIKSEILTPLGLTETFGTLRDVDISKVASGYDSHYEGDVKQLDFVSPGGSMVASSRDVGNFLRALNTGGLLSKEEQAIYSSIYEYGHTGLLPGYQSIARYDPESDSVVILFVNTSGGNAWTLTELIYSRILKILRK
jgi:CubicO group peptidase (beta-lactamase class C family)